MRPQRNLIRNLFSVIIGFCVLLSLYYVTLTSSEAIEGSTSTDVRPPYNTIISDKDRELQEKRYWKDKALEEKYIIEDRIWKDYHDRVPLERPYITHYFNEKGNITHPLQKPFLFLHVAKTAGSTLSSVFKRSERPTKFTHTWAHPKIQDMPSIIQKDIVFGHFRYGLHYYFNRSCTYMTVLRDPIDRVVSHYYYHRQHKKDPGHDFAMNRTFEQWIIDSPAGNNEQTRQLSGLRTQFNITEEILDMAMYHMRQFAVVGLTEKYHETLIMMRHIAGLKVTRYRAVNKGVKRPKLADVPEATVELIKQRNWADIELYKLAKEIFEKQLEVMPPQYATDLAAFEILMKQKKSKSVLLDKTKTS